MLRSICAIRRPLGRSALSWPLIDLLVTQCTPGHSPSSQLPKTSWSSVILAAYSAPDHSAPSSYPAILANRGSFGLLVPFWQLAQSVILKERIGRSWVRLLNPKQRHTEHTSIQGMTWPKAKRLINDAKAKLPYKNSWHEGRREVRNATNTKKGAKHPGRHEQSGMD